MASIYHNYQDPCFCPGWIGEGGGGGMAPVPLTINLAIMAVVKKDATNHSARLYHKAIPDEVKRENACACERAQVNGMCSCAHSTTLRALFTDALVQCAQFSHVYSTFISITSSQLIIRLVNWRCSHSQRM